MRDSVLALLSADIIASTRTLENHRSKYFEFLNSESHFTELTVLLYSYLSVINRDDFDISNIEQLSIVFKSKILPYLSRITSLNLYEWCIDVDLFKYNTLGYSSLLPIIALSMSLLSKKGIPISIENIRLLNSLTYNEINPTAEQLRLLNLIKIISDNKLQFEDKISYIHSDFGDDIKIIDSMLTSDQIDRNDLSAKSILNLAAYCVVNSKSCDDIIRLSISLGGKSNILSMLSIFIGIFLFNDSLLTVEDVSTRFRLFDNDLLNFYLNY